MLIDCCYEEENLFCRGVEGFGFDVFDCKSDLADFTLKLLSERGNFCPHFDFSGIEAR